MPSAPGGPRVLLRRLREIMAEPVSAQDRLDKIVILIAANMVAEVCSVYVMRGDGVLELFATEGLNRDAVHLTTMRSGEGLVGLIAATAEPLALSDAQTPPGLLLQARDGRRDLPRLPRRAAAAGRQHPRRPGRPEPHLPGLCRGGDRGAPDHRHGAGRDDRLRRAAGAGARRDRHGAAPPGAPARRRRSPMASASAMWCCTSPASSSRTSSPRTSRRSSQRLETAIGEVRASIDELIERGDVAHHGEHREVLETFRMFAHDQGWLRRMREAVTSGLTAEAAVERVQSDNRARMLRQTDPYLRERLHDLDDLANRLLHRLVGRDLVAERGSLPENAIIVARSMGPAALLDYDRSRLRGLVLEEGGPTSHIAIVARALGIPAVGEVANATSLVEPGDAIIVDGGAGRRADPARSPTSRRPTPKRRACAPGGRSSTASCATCRPSPRTASEITLQLNAGLLVDLPHLRRDRAPPASACSAPSCSSWSPSGCPRATEQQALYKAVFAAAGDMPVTFRTLDIGGDKILPYMQAVEEENPALGWRAIRIGLDRPACCARRSARCSRPPAGDRCKIMFPMVATCDEFVRAKAIVRARDDLSLPPRPRTALRPEARRDAGDPLAPVPDRGDLRERRISSRSARTI